MYALSCEGSLRRSSEGARNSKRWQIDDTWWNFCWISLDILSKQGSILYIISLFTSRPSSSANSPFNDDSHLFTNAYCFVKISSVSTTIKNTYTFFRQLLASFLVLHLVSTARLNVTEKFYSKTSHRCVGTAKNIFELSQKMWARILMLHVLLILAVIVAGHKLAARGLVSFILCWTSVRTPAITEELSYACPIQFSNWSSRESLSKMTVANVKHNVLCYVFLIKM